MGLLGKLIKNAVGEGIAKGIGDAVGKAAEKALTPAAERLTNAVSNGINRAADTIEETEAAINNDSSKSENSFEEAAMKLAGGSVFASVLKNFPEWKLSPIKDISDNEEEDYISLLITADFDDDMLEQYQSVLAANGFTGGFQMKEKIIGGRKHIVDFSFVSDSQLQYIIYK